MPKYKIFYTRNNIDINISFTSSLTINEILDTWNNIFPKNQVKKIVNENENKIVYEKK